MVLEYHNMLFRHYYKGLWGQLFYVNKALVFADFPNYAFFNQRVVKEWVLWANKVNVVIYFLDTLHRIIFQMQSTFAIFNFNETTLGTQAIIWDTHCRNWENMVIIITVDRGYFLFLNVKYLNISSLLAYY